MLTKYLFSGFEFRPIRFGVQEMQEIARVSAESIAARIGRGLNVNDSPARPLNPAYARAKARRGLSGIRDWRFTGATISQLGVIDARDGSASVGLRIASGEKLGKLASYNARVEQMVGLSPADQARTNEKLAEMFSEKVRENG